MVIILLFRRMARGRAVQGRQGPGPCGVTCEAWVPRLCPGELESCHLLDVKEYRRKEHPSACWRLFKWLGKPVFITDSGTGSLRLPVFARCELTHAKILVTHAKIPFAVLANSKLQHLWLSIAAVPLLPLETSAFCLQYIRDTPAASPCSLSFLFHLCSPEYLGQLAFSCFSSLSEFISPTGNNFLLSLPSNNFLHNPPLFWNS